MTQFRIPTFINNYTFNKEDALRQEQERIALENEKRGLQYNSKTGTWAKPTSRTIQPKPNSYWNNIASQYGFKDMQAVKDWQAKNGLVVDGKFGKNSLARWNALQNTPTSAKPSNKKLKPTIEVGIPKVIGIQQVYQPVQNTKSQPTTKPQSKPNQNNSNKSINSIQPTISRYTMNNTVRGDFGIGKGLRNMASNFLNWINDVAANTQTNRNRAINVHGRYQQGGKLEDSQKAFIAYLIQVSGAQSEQELNDFIQSLGEDGLKQQYQQFIQTMQNGTQSAKNGVKLNYIKSLRGICPEGFELGYFKEGGQICAKCVEKREKMGGIPFRPIQGEQGTKVVQDFKKDLKNKKDKIKMSKKNPEKKELGGTLSINQELLDMFKCGGKTKKTKKKEEGGLIKKKSGIPIKEKFIEKDKCGKKMKKKK